MKLRMKNLLLLLVLCLSLVAFAACGSDEPAEDATTDETATTQTETTGDYVELEENLGAEEYGIGFRNEDVALGMEVQKHLDDMIADGTAAEISQKWFGEDALIADADYMEDTTIAEDDTSLTDLQERGTLIVGLDASFPPMGYMDDNNEIVGFDVDLAKEVAARMNVELELKPIEWDAKEMELTSGNIDCIWNGMTITDERVENMFIAKPYLANAQIVIVAADSGITTLADMDGKVVGLQKESSAKEALDANTEVAESVSEVREFDNNLNAYLDLQSGRIDCFVVDKVVGEYILTNGTSVFE
ncbi:MAG: transporter substrate-binding domain-containing protein [Bacillota bacterium]|nr:transporter substrate-binding domain-containing protein [Bacillota bacterium]